MPIAVENGIGRRIAEMDVAPEDRRAAARGTTRSLPSLCRPSFRDRDAHRAVRQRFERHVPAARYATEIDDFGEDGFARGLDVDRWEQRLLRRLELLDGRVARQFGRWSGKR